MKFISHRGNLTGKNKARENTPDYIIEALEAGFDVEVDVWFKENGLFYLGHDEPIEELPIDDFLSTRKWKKLWFHCKNLEAIFEFSTGIFDFDFFSFPWRDFTHFFWHNTDKVTMTSKGYLWTYPGEEISPLSICVCPESEGANYSDADLERAYGICSDNIAHYRDLALKNIQCDGQ